MKRLLILAVTCILLAGCSSKMEEEVKKTTSYTVDEVRTIFEKEGYKFDFKVNEQNDAKYVYIAKDDIVLMQTTMTQDGQNSKLSVARNKNGVYIWTDDVAYIDKCIYEFKEKRTADNADCSDAQIKELEKSKQSFLNLLKKLDLSAGEIETLFSRIFNENI